MILLFLFFFIFHIIQLTPHKLSAELKNLSFSIHRRRPSSFTVTVSPATDDFPFVLLYSQEVAFQFTVAVPID